MKLQNPQAKQQLISRLRRIEGQMRGIETMLSEERDCQEILQQLTAVRSALQSANLFFLQAYASDCLLNAQENIGREEREQLIKNLMEILNKAI
ncbi:MAG: metal-sensitive transcriptional regulator [Anaerolineales bacterium]|jgi:DNA-binding FrmR family transcriptional regulator